jgi:protease-4
MWRAVERTNQVKPVVVSMGGMAASGGYYLAAPARRIFANAATITGSIGVYYGKADVSELMRRVGVDIEVYKTTPNADADSVYRAFTPEERQRLRATLRYYYRLFVERVAKGRNLDPKAVEQVAQGKIWTGRQASTRGLVDEIGGLRQALAYARRLGNLSPDSPVVELPPPDGSLLGRVLGVQGLHSQESPSLPQPIADLARAAAPFAVHQPDQPLMRLEIAPVVE